MITSATRVVRRRLPPVRDDPLDPVRDELHVRPRQSRYQALENAIRCSHHVVRDAPGAQLRIGDLRAELRRHSCIGAASSLGDRTKPLVSSSP